MGDDDRPKGHGTAVVVNQGQARLAADRSRRRWQSSPRGSRKVRRRNGDPTKAYGGCPCCTPKALQSRYSWKLYHLAELADVERERAQRPRSVQPQVILDGTNWLSSSPLISAPSMPEAPPRQAQAAPQQLDLCCVKCGADFIVGTTEVQFFRCKGLHIPKRCRECRRSGSTSQQRAKAQAGKALARRIAKLACYPAGEPAPPEE